MNGGDQRTGRISRFATYPSAFLLLASGILFLTGFISTAHSYLAKYDHFCPSKMSEGEIPLDRTWIERLMGIERDETSCSAVMYRLTCEVRPILAFEEEGSQPITVTLLFSGRRTSCRGRSTGAFEACMPEGATIEKVEIRAFSSRNGNIRHYKE